MTVYHLGKTGFRERPGSLGDYSLFTHLPLGGQHPESTGGPCACLAPTLNGPSSLALPYAGCLPGTGCYT